MTCNPLINIDVGCNSPVKSLIVGIGQTLLMASLAEYCGIWPTAGGQCFYTQMVAPPKMRRFLSFVVAWSILVGEVSTSSSCALNSAQIVEALVQITHPEFHWRVDSCISLPTSCNPRANRHMCRHG